MKFKAQGGFGRVDHENGIIHEVSLLESGREASGHGFWVDMKMVRQAVKQGKASGELGLKARMDHPSACFSSMGSQLGRIKNFKAKGYMAVADLHIGEFAKHSPSGDIRKWLLSVAEHDPSQVGFSISFMMSEPEDFTAGEDDNDEDLEFILPHARIDTLYGADVVDEGAATSSLFEEGIIGRPNYLAEQAQLWMTEKADMVKGIFKPLVNELIKENINQKSINMSDDKKSTIEAEFAVTPEAPAAKEVAVEAPVVDYKAEYEAKEVELSAHLSEIEALKAEIEAKENEADTELSTALSAIEELKFSINELKKVSLGTTVDPVANTDDSVELSEEAKEARALEIKEANTATWINEGFGNTVS